MSTEPHWPWGQPLEGIVQQGFITGDIDAEMGRYAAALGIGPWFIRRDFGFDRLLYRGEPAKIALDLAIAFTGSTMIELIQQKDDSPSAYRETRDRQGYGFHHWAWAARPDSYDTRLAKLSDRGFVQVFDLAVAVGGRAAYFDPGPGYAGMIELIEIPSELETLFTQVHQASLDWDGRDPIREF